MSAHSLWRTKQMCKELHSRICFIIPPHIHESIARNGNDRQKEHAYQALSVSAHMRGQREILNTFTMLATTPTGVKRRTICNAQNGLSLPGKLVRGEGDPKSSDTSVNEAYDVRQDLRFLPQSVRAKLDRRSRAAARFIGALSTQIQ